MEKKLYYTFNPNLIQSCTCPWCNRDVIFNVLVQLYYTLNVSIPGKGPTSKTKVTYLFGQCPNCSNPVLFSFDTGSTIPSAFVHNDIKNLPEDISKLYSEMKNVYSASAYSSCVMLSRKILMHVAVEENAPTGKKFIEYIDYLDTNHYTPPKSKAWIDKIRVLGNEENHEIKIASREEADLSITFLSMILAFLYDYPNR